MQFRYFFFFFPLSNISFLSCFFLLLQCKNIVLFPASGTHVASDFSSVMNMEPLVGLEEAVIGESADINAASEIIRLLL